jgi:adenylate kinase family enzyme
LKCKTIKDGTVKIIVEKVRIEGAGAILLTGPSSCGKGEISKELCRILSIPKERYLSMGEILRQTIKKARNDKIFSAKLAADYLISDQISIFNSSENNEDTLEKAMKHKTEVLEYYKKDDITQLDWLEFCVIQGLLVPDDWTMKVVNATFAENEIYKNEIFILDGYPRTLKAADALLDTFALCDIPIIKIIHLSITKEEMIKRAYNRNRLDDTIGSLERRYQFYIESVQPSIDYLKLKVGSSKVALIDAHQPEFTNGQIDLSKSIRHVALSVLQSLEIPSYLLDI